MPEARDRLSREHDAIAAYSRRRNSRTGDRNVGRGGSITFVLGDENEERQAPATPFRWRGTAMVGTPGHIGVASGRGGTRSPIIGRNAQIIGRENISPVQGSGRVRTRGRGSPLPTWYPRRPLGDVTAVVRVIEGRERSRGGQGQETEGPILPGWLFHEPSVSTSGARTELDPSMISPRPTILKRQCPPTIGKVPKILLNITQRSDGDSVCLTPQKKLLNDIDTVEKVVMEELRKLKRTPSAKKAEREKRVKTLMSMR